MNEIIAKITVWLIIGIAVLTFIAHCWARV